MRRMIHGICLSLATFVLVVTAPLSEAQAQMCVKIARSLTNFDIRGDAWAWWENAAERYQRGSRPTAGSVLVFKRTGQLRRGHVSTVSAVLSSRVVTVDHSWLEGHGLVRGMRVIDTSAGNDWSSVRVWHPPTNSLGMRAYPTYGFILPDRPRGNDRPPRFRDLEMASAPAPMAPLARSIADRFQRVDLATLPFRQAVLPHRDQSARLPELLIPARKPGGLSLPVVQVAQNTAASLINLPRRKPTAVVAVVRETPVQVTASIIGLPSRKPGAVATRLAVPQVASRGD